MYCILLNIYFSNEKIINKVLHIERVLRLGNKNFISSVQGKVHDLAYLKFYFMYF